MIKGSTKILITSLVLLGFASVTMFWWTGMHEGGHHNCISATVQNEVCPNATSPEAAVFHLKTLQSLTTSVLQKVAEFSSLLALVFVAFLGLARFGDDRMTSAGIRRENAPLPFPPKEYQRWLSLLEHSPSFSPGRV